MGYLWVKSGEGKINVYSGIYLSGCMGSALGTTEGI